MRLNVIALGSAVLLLDSRLSLAFVGRSRCELRPPRVGRASVGNSGGGAPLTPDNIPERVMLRLARNDLPDMDAGLRFVWGLTGETTRFIFKSNETDFVDTAHETAVQFPTSFYGAAMHGRGYALEGDPVYVGVSDQADLTQREAAWIATQLVKTTSSDGRVRRWQWELRKHRRPPQRGEWYIESIGSSDKDGDFEPE